MNQISGLGLVDIGTNQWVWIDSSKNKMEDVSLPPDGSSDPELVAVSSDADPIEIQTAPAGVYMHVLSDDPIYNAPEGNLIALAYESVNEPVLEITADFRWLGLANGRWVAMSFVGKGEYYSGVEEALVSIAKQYQTPGEEGLTPSKFVESMDAAEYVKLLNRTIEAPDDMNYFVTEPTLVWTSIGPTGHVNVDLGQDLRQHLSIKNWSMQNAL